ncbi:hypothetical protein PILCRDRAFT_12346 [Piloderma croceum F 1598]|uniref:Uncharacterized protein n=1 Tax=Piloderma croceum (strain F 1598) TaxID=765440 RepID=A0A0C3FB88_PILCF|nr:hypothetical protein PILCRDRAFT_12346 [Piloderma croceum F 1598]
MTLSSTSHRQHEEVARQGSEYTHRSAKNGHFNSEQTTCGGLGECKDWLAASRTGGDNRPTPFQLGMLVNVLQAPDFATICEACTSVVGFGPASKAQPLRKPQILGTAVALHLGGGPTLQRIPYQGSFPMLTRQLNRTLCDSTDIQPPSYSPLCGMIKAGHDSKIGLIVSATATIPDNADFTASTYGVHTACQSIASHCINQTYTGPDAYLALNCALSTTFNLSTPTTATAASFGILNSSGHVLESNPYDVDSNPFSFAAVLTSHTYTGREDEFVNNTGFFSMVK